MSSFNGLQPWLREYAKSLVGHFPGLTITSVYRSETTQRRLYARRPAHPCPDCSPPTYPVAPPGRSYHQYGRAFDLVGDAATLAAAGATWNSWGGTWSPKDPIHFQA